VQIGTAPATKKDGSSSSDFDKAKGIVSKGMALAINPCELLAVNPWRLSHDVPASPALALPQTGLQWGIRSLDEHSVVWASQAFSQGASCLPTSSTHVVGRLKASDFLGHAGTLNIFIEFFGLEAGPFPLGESDLSVRRGRVVPTCAWTAAGPLGHMHAAPAASAPACPASANLEAAAAQVLESPAPMAPCRS
jgi:hypothetical protein